MKVKKRDLVYLENQHSFALDQIVGKGRELMEKVNLSEVLRHKKHLETNRTFIYFCFKEGTGTKYQPPSPYLDTTALYYGLYRRRQEEWLTFHPLSNEWPTEDELKRASALILPGSRASVYEKEKSWISEVLAFLRKCYENHKHLKFLAVCFGL
jgi:hypothetical protein